MPATGAKIDPAAIYDDASLYAELEISLQAIASARREGRLRHTRQGRRILYLGEWVIAWLTADSAPVGGKGVARAV
jgi:hypothetical protein